MENFLADFPEIIKRIFTEHYVMYVSKDAISI